MVNKKAWIRIVEACIAILIIFIVILSVSRLQNRTTERDLAEVVSPLLEEIAKNVTMREMIISDTANSDAAENSLRGFLGARLRDPNIGYNVTICDSYEVCSLERYPGDVSGSIYAGSRIISSVLTNSGQPKKISLFLWIKQ